jgi:hypothetical protein
MCCLQVLDPSLEADLSTLLSFKGPADLFVDARSYKHSGRTAMHGTCCSHVLDPSLTAAPVSLPVF